jgi:hypothetical protein
MARHEAYRVPPGIVVGCICVAFRDFNRGRSTGPDLRYMLVIFPFYLSPAYSLMAARQLVVPTQSGCFVGKPRRPTASLGSLGLLGLPLSLAPGSNALFLCICTPRGNGVLRCLCGSQLISLLTPVFVCLQSGYAYECSSAGYAPNSPPFEVYALLYFR